MAQVEIWDFFDFRNPEEHKGSPESIIKKLKEKADSLSNSTKNKSLSEWTNLIRRVCKLPDWCVNLLKIKGVSLYSDLATIFALAYGFPGCGWIIISKIRWDDESIIKKRDLLIMLLGGEDKLKELEDLGEFLFGD